MYTIDGTWMFDRYTAYDWRRALGSFHAIGGTTILQFGPSLTRSNPKKLRADPPWEFVKHPDDSHDVDHVLQEIGEHNIGTWLTFNANERLGQDLLLGPHDKEFEVKLPSGRRGTYWRVVIGRDDNKFDIVYAKFESSKPTSNSPDAKELLLEMADEFDGGLNVLLSMPKLPAKPGQDYLIDQDILPAYWEVCRRVLRSYARRHSPRRAFIGFYQGFEVQLRAGDDLQSVYDSYRRLRRLIDQVFWPPKLLAVSPYWNVNVDYPPASRISEIAAAYRRLAQTGVDIVAVQDGRGAGKAALYWPYQATEAIQDVDRALGRYPQVDGQRSFADHFSASTRELYRALRAVTADLQTQGLRVDLWANVEAFEEDREDEEFTGTANHQNLRPTTRYRLDRAVMFAAAEAQRVISFMWDDLFLAPRPKPSGPPSSLLDEIQLEPDAPLVTLAFFFRSSAKPAEPSVPGLIIRGYNIAVSGTELALTWYETSDQAPRSRTVLVGDEGWANPHRGSSDQANPPRIQEIWVPFDQSRLLPDWYVHIQAVSAQRSRSPIYSYAYGQL